jgi:hypothetical protein
VQSRGEPPLGCNKGGVSLHPLRQSLTGRVLGGELRGGLRTGIDFMTKHSRDQVRALREVPVYGSDPHAGLVCDFSHRSIYSRDREYRLSRPQQGLEVALCVGPHAPIRAVPMFGAIGWFFRFNDHHVLGLTNGTMFRINTECGSA